MEKKPKVSTTIKLTNQETMQKLRIIAYRKYMKQNKILESALEKYVEDYEKENGIITQEELDKLEKK